MVVSIFKLIWIWGEAKNAVFRGESAIESKSSPVNVIKGDVDCSLGFAVFPRKIGIGTNPSVFHLTAPLD